MDFFCVKNAIIKRLLDLSIRCICPHSIWKNRIKEMNDIPFENTIVNDLIKRVDRCNWSNSVEGERIVTEISKLKSKLVANGNYKEHADVALEIMSSLMSTIFGMKGQCNRLLNKNK